MQDLLSKFVTKEALYSLFRQGLIFLGAWLVTKGYAVLDEKTAGEVAGALALVASTLWSAFNAKQKNTLKQAVSGELPVDHPSVVAIVPDPAPVVTPSTAPIQPPTIV